MNQILVDPITLETFDLAFYNWAKNIIHPLVSTNKGFVEASVLWKAQERSYQIKNNLFIRDDITQGYKFPLISISKKSCILTQPDKRPIPASIPENQDYRSGIYKIHSKIVQDKTANFANADSYGKTGQVNFKLKENPRVVETWFIKYPLFYDVEYEVKVETNYEQHMNQILQVFDNFPRGSKTFVIKYDEHQFECFPGDRSVSNNSDSLADTERKFEGVLTYKLLGYTTFQDQNQKTPIYIKRESPAKIRFQKIGL